ncbi:MAG: hypothetical protein FJ090_18465 [Deltaproteobacteria bacterium]|nr:hypothetical protein [Deltaproteobacteria bacterium]
MLYLLLACPEPEKEATTHEAGAGNEEDFLGGAEAVRVTAPANGETVASTFTLSYRVGEAVRAVELLANDAPVASATELDGSLVVTLDEGKYELALVGYDGDEELSRDTLSVRVSDGGSWVTITSPSDGAEVANPVTFTVTSSSDVGVVELLADGWSIGTVDTDGDGEGTLSYTFSGTGYAPRSRRWAAPPPTRSASPSPRKRRPASRPSTTSCGNTWKLTRPTAPTGTTGRPVRTGRAPPATSGTSTPWWPRATRRGAATAWA